MVEFLLFNSIQWKKSDPPDAENRVLVSKVRRYLCEGSGRGCWGAIAELGEVSVVTKVDKPGNGSREGSLLAEIIFHIATS